MRVMFFALQKRFMGLGRLRRGLFFDYVKRFMGLVSFAEVYEFMGYGEMWVFLDRNDGG